MENKYIFITGDGSNLTKYFLNKYHLAICFNNFVTNNNHDIQLFLNRSDHTLVEGDICSLPIYHNGTQGVQCELVGHLKRYSSYNNSNTVNVEIKRGPKRAADNPHWQASIDNTAMGYQLTHTL